MSKGARWRISRTAKILAVLALGFLAIAIGPALYLKSQCQSEGAQTPLAYHIAIQSKDGEGTNENTQRQTVRIIPFADGLHALPETNRRIEAIYYAPKEPVDWWHRFLCEVNAADYLLALFTFVLAISTGLLWRETERLAEGAVDQSRKMEQSIRQTKRLAIATMASARAARISAAVAETSLYVARRAYVVVETVGVNVERDVMSDITHVTVKLIWRNTGTNAGN